jgi:hypothetical protein
MNDFPYLASPGSTPSSSAPFSPMTFGQILDRTYRLIRAKFWLLVGIAAVPSALLILVIGSIDAAIWIPMIKQWPRPPSPEMILAYFTPAILIPVVVIFILLSIGIAAIYAAAAFYAATQADSGVKVTFSQAYGLAWAHAGRHLWLLVLLYLYACLPLVLVEGTFALVTFRFALTRATLTPATFLLIGLGALLYIAALVYMILVGLRLSLAFPACVAEGLAAVPAIKRSFHLTQGAKGRIFLVILVVYAIIYAVLIVAELAAIIVGAIGTFIAVALHLHLAPPWSYIALAFLGICVLVAGILFISLTYAGLTTALAVLYHDQRRRKDGPLTALPQTGDAV